jgi:Rab GDP dissociation inhibitor
MEKEGKATTMAETGGRVCHSRVFFSLLSYSGHAMALQDSDEYLSKPALDTMMNVKLYGESLARYGKSPFIYPEYGLGGLPEGFSRLCAINGGTFMLNKNVDEVLYNADGTVAGIRSGSGDEAEIALAPLVIGDPSYFNAGKVAKTGRIIRTICILNHPVAGLENPDSAMIVIPASQCGRKNDIYVTIVGKHHEVSAKGRYVAIVSTTVETDRPELEVEPGLALLGEMITRFNNIVDTYTPKDDGIKSRAFITSSYDATSHFERTTDEVLDLYQRIFGEPFDLSKPVELPTE